SDPRVEDFRTESARSSAIRRGARRHLRTLALVPERAWPQRPFASIDHLHAALTAVVAAAGKDEQLALIRAHPELAGKAMAEGSLTADSTVEQSGAGLTHCSSAELTRLRELNVRYKEKFDLPSLLAVRSY